MKITTFNPAEFTAHLQSSTHYYCYYKTPAGILRVFSTALGIYKTEFVDKETLLADYTLVDAITPTGFILVGTPFQIQVWQAALKIPRGKTTNYKTIAHRIGKPTAFRAVANALKQNNIAFYIPCHRVLKANNDICGYNWGVGRKKQLLEAEGIKFMQ